MAHINHLLIIETGWHRYRYRNISKRLVVPPCTYPILGMEKQPIVKALWWCTLKHGSGHTFCWSALHFQTWKSNKDKSVQHGTHIWHGTDMHCNHCCDVGNNPQAAFWSIRTVKASFGSCYWVEHRTVATKHQVWSMLQKPAFARSSTCPSEKQGIKSSDFVSN